jgi:plasmid stability protein
MVLTPLRATEKFTARERSPIPDDGVGLGHGGFGSRAVERTFYRAPLSDRIRRQGLSEHPAVLLAGQVLFLQRGHSMEDAIMAAVTIRNLSDEAHRALKVRAARHNRSAEAEMRAILEAAVRPEGRVRLGATLREIGRKHDITNAGIEAIEQVRDTRLADPMTFE